MILTNEEKQSSNQEQQQAMERLHEAVTKFLENETNENELGELDALLWETLLKFRGHTFYTVKKLEFSYTIRRSELFVIRQEKEIIWEKKSITRATILLAFHNALTLQKSGMKVSGPKKLKTFGASYLYPVFIQFHIIRIL